MKGTNKCSFTAGLLKGCVPMRVAFGRSAGILFGALIVGAWALAGLPGVDGGGFLPGSGTAPALAGPSDYRNDRGKPPDEVLRILEARVQKAEEREHRALEAERQVKLLQADLAKRLEEMRKERKEFLKLLEGSKQKEDENLVSLANSLAETPPERAGLILNELEADLSAAILKRMNKRKAGKIWGFLAAERAASISRVLANRMKKEKEKVIEMKDMDEMNEMKADGAKLKPRPEKPGKLLPPKLSIE